MGTVIVGVDGSDGSRRALEWAVDEARTRGWDVHAMYVWQHAEAPVVPGPLCSHHEQVAAAHRLVDRVVDSTDARGLAHPIERIVCEGSAGRVLVEASTGADLLVVGARGLGGLSRLLLGSVSSHVVHHAACPVLVVRE